MEVVTRNSINNYLWALSPLDSFFTAYRTRSEEVNKRAAAECLQN